METPFHPLGPGTPDRAPDVRATGHPAGSEVHAPSHPAPDTAPAPGRRVRAASTRLLVSVRGPIEAVEAARGGASIVDVVVPGSAAGTPYPLNLASVRNRLRDAGFSRRLVSTSLGSAHPSRAAVVQAALGVVAAGVDVVRIPIVELTLEAAVYLVDSVVRTVRRLGPSGTRIVPVVYLDRDLRRFFHPWREGPELARRAGTDGIQVDTWDKLRGQRLLDLATLEDVANLAIEMHEMGLEAWVSGRLEGADLPGLAGAGVDVVAVRGAALAPPRGRARRGQVEASLVRSLARRLGHPSPAPARGAANSI